MTFLSGFWMARTILDPILDFNLSRTGQNIGFSNDLNYGPNPSKTGPFKIQSLKCLLFKWYRFLKGPILEPSTLVVLVCKLSNLFLLSPKQLWPKDNILVQIRKPTKKDIEMHRLLLSQRPGIYRQSSIFLITN